MKNKSGYTILMQRIAKLQAEADRVRKSELRDVVAKIKVAIDHYQIKPEDLYVAGMPRTTLASKVQPGPKSTKAKPSKRVLSTAPKYGDGTGNSWVGRGPRPHWFREALALGKKPEELLLTAV